jgi:hypothetical protein
VCVCVRARACVRACVLACVRACLRACVCVCMVYATNGFATSLCVVTRDWVSEGGDAVGGRLPRDDAMWTCGVDTNVWEKHTFYIF